MSVQVKRRRDTAVNVAAYAGAQGELIVDVTNNRLTIHDGVTPGGWAAAKLSEVLTSGRSAVSDVNYAALVSDRTIAYTAITANRVVTLPAASSFPVGTPLWVMDESGSASASKTISFAPNGSDLIDGAASAVISSAYGFVMLMSNGAASPNGKWTLVDQANSSLGPVGIGTAADPANPLSVYGASALFNGANFNFTLNKSASGNTASVLFQDGFSGRAQVGLCGDDNFHFKVSPNGSTWLEALNLNATTGQPSFPQGIAAGEAVGFRNRLRNASFAINQRGVSGTVTLGAGAYGHDGVKAGASGATYTFATSGLDTTLTITAGSLILPIESMLIEGGTYTLSQAGAAQARVWQGTGFSGSGFYASTPFQVTGMTAATQTNVEFSTGTVLRPQFEPGSVATAFERRPPGVEIGICQRYYVAIGIANVSGSAVSSTACLVTFAMPPMRAAPTVALLMTSFSAASYNFQVASYWLSVSALSIFSSAASANACNIGLSGFAGLTPGQIAGGNLGGSLFSLSAEI